VTFLGEEEEEEEDIVRMVDAVKKRLNINGVDAGIY